MLLIFLFVFGHFIENLNYFQNEKKIISDQESIRRRFSTKTLSPIAFHVDPSNTQQTREVPEKNSETPLPRLVPLVFPPGFFEKQGKQIVNAIETKMTDMFGKEAASEIESMDSQAKIFDYVSNMDFNNCVVNFVVKHCFKFMKPSENKPLEGITSREECRKTCRYNQSSTMKFIQRIFQAILSKFSDEDLRFKFYQDSKRCFKYSYDPEKNEHYCKCVDKGYGVKVSPNLLKIINERYFNKENVGDLLAEKILEENVNEYLSKVNSMFSLKSIGNMFLYYTGFQKDITRWDHCSGHSHRPDPMEFFFKHLMINILLFIFCHCIWYFHVIYFIIAFIYYLL